VIDGGKEEERKRDDRFRNVGRGRTQKKKGTREQVSVYVCTSVIVQLYGREREQAWSMGELRRREKREREQKRKSTTNGTALSKRPCWDCEAR